MNIIKIKYTAFMMTLLFFLVDNSAYAQAKAGKGSNSGQGKLKFLLETKYFATGLTWLFVAIAIVQWFDYFNKFDFQNAVTSALKPAGMTFMAFNWLKFANWVGLI